MKNGSSGLGVWDCDWRVGIGTVVALEEVVTTWPLMCLLGTGVPSCYGTRFEPLFGCLVEQYIGDKICPRANSPFLELAIFIQLFSIPYPYSPIPRSPYSPFPLFTDSPIPRSFETGNKNIVTHITDDRLRDVSGCVMLLVESYIFFPLPPMSAPTFSAGKDGALGPDGWRNRVCGKEDF